MNTWNKAMPILHCRCILSAINKCHKYIKTYLILWKKCIALLKGHSKCFRDNNFKFKQVSIHQGVRQGFIATSCFYLTLMKRNILRKNNSTSVGALARRTDCSRPTLVDDVTLVDITQNMKSLLIIADRFTHEWEFQYVTDKSVAITFPTKQDRIIIRC